MAGIPTWLPVVITFATGSWPSQDKTTLMYSGLGSSGISLDTLAFIVAAKGISKPDMALAAGKTYKWLVTVAETGLPETRTLCMNYSKDEFYLVESE